MRVLELGDRLTGAIRSGVSEVVAVLRVEVAGFLVTPVARNNAAEAGLGSLYRAVNKGELGDVVFVDHAQYWFLLGVMVLRVLMLLLVRRLQFTEAVVGHKAESLLLGLAVERAEWHGQTTGCQAVQVLLFIAFLKVNGGSLTILRSGLSW